MTSPTVPTEAPTIVASTGAPTVSPGPRRHYWQRFTGTRGTPRGAELAALRRGLGREPGTVPTMWPYYTTLAADGATTRALHAEHVALTLFAVHQQSKSTLVHQDGVGLGTAMLRLKQSGRYSPDAVDRRFAAAATATTLSELAVHLRGLISQLRSLEHSELDYTQLADDLRRWQNTEQAGRVRRRWGSQYHARPTIAETTPAKKPNGSTESTTSAERNQPS